MSNVFVSFNRFANILILLTFPEMMILLYDVWMSNIIAQGRYKHWPEIKILINVSEIAAIIIELCYYVITGRQEAVGYLI